MTEATDWARVDELLLEEARRSLDQQEADLHSLRSRASAILGFAGVVLGLFGIAVDPRDGNATVQMLGWAGLTLFVGATLAVAFVVSPRQLRFRHERRQAGRRRSWRGGRRARGVIVGAQPLEELPCQRQEVGAHALGLLRRFALSIAANRLAVRRPGRWRIPDMTSQPSRPPRPAPLPNPVRPGVRNDPPPPPRPQPRPNRG